MRTIVSCPDRASASMAFDCLASDLFLRGHRVSSRETWSASDGSVLIAIGHDVALTSPMITRLENAGATVRVVDDAGLKGPWLEADQIHAALMHRADELMGCSENSQEEHELAVLSTMIELYEQARWPKGKIDGGKG